MSRMHSAIGAVALLGVLLCSPFVSQDARGENGQCAWEGGPGVAVHASCAVEDCAESGGLLQCAEPDLHASQPYTNDDVLGERWVFDSCDDYTWYDSAWWCQAANSTFDGIRCVGLPPGYLGDAQTTNNEAAIITTADTFVQLRFPTCPTSTISDTGWGPHTGDSQCMGMSPQQPKYRNGKLLQDYRRKDYLLGGSCQNGVRTIWFTKHRDLKCPTGYTPRNRPDGNLECYIPAEACCTFKGQSTSMMSGGNHQNESDYSSPSGSLSFGRSYSSTGRYRPPGSSESVQVNTDYWRHNYDRRLFPVNGSPIMATVQRPDGTLWQFDNTGKERLNRDGGAARLTASPQGWILKLANSDVEEYDAAARLVSITTRAGVRTNLTYDSNNRLATVTDQWGQQLQLTYGSAGLASVTLPDGSQISYGYDSRQRLTSVTYPDSSTRTYHYEQVGFPWLLTGISDESSQRFATYTYSEGRLVEAKNAGDANRYTFSTNPWNPGARSVTYPNGASAGFNLYNVAGVYRVGSIIGACPDCDGLQAVQFDANGNRSSSIDYRSIRTTYVYDLARNLETQRTEGLTSWGAATANTRTTQTAWHPDFRIPTSISIYSGATATGTPLQVTSFTHDASGNVLTKTISDPAANQSRTWTYTYNAFGKVLTEDGPRTDVSDTTVYTYHDCNTGYQCGEVHTITNALGHTTTYNTYNAHGLPLTITDPNGVVTTLTYDLRQRLTSRTVGTEASTFEYWPTGLLKKATLPDGSYLEYTYDAAHRLTDINDAEGNRVHYTLDGLGNRTGEQAYDPSNALTRTRTRLFNALGLVQQEIGAAGTANVTTTYSYDDNRNQTAIAAPLGRDTAQRYDELNRLSEVTDPLNGVTYYGYNGLDQLLSVTDPKGLTTSYTYNGLGDLKTQTSPDTGVTTKTYDSGGNLATSTDARNAVTTYTHDALNRVKTASFATGSTADPALTYTYDAGTHGKGRMTGVSDSNHSLSWTYDAHGRVLTAGQTVGSISKTTSYSYANGLRQSMTTPSGQVITYAYTNGKVTSISVNGTLLVSNILYDPFGPVRQWTWSNGSLAVRTFDHDGKVTQIDSGILKTYSYDDAFRITGITDTSNSAFSWTYGYDDLDRLTSASSTGTTLGYTYDANGNRLTQTGANASTFTIAANSNRLSSTSGALTRTYGYDNAGNTTSYAGLSFTYNNRGRMSSSTKNGVTTTYTYNALGQLIKKGANTLYYYDDAGHILGTYTGTGALVEEIVWLGDIPIISLRPRATGGVNIYNIHTDHLNTPRLITGSVNPGIRWRWDAEPFGGGTVNNNPSGAGVFEFNLRFPGQIFVAETGLNYNYYRDYDPATGKYVQSDPIGLDGGLNTYLYADADPILKIDPAGEAAASIGAGIAAGIGLGIRACMRLPACKKAIEEAIKNCKDVRCKFERHTAHHNFPKLGWCEHYSLTCWIKGQKGPPLFRGQWPFPGRCSGQRFGPMEGGGNSRPPGVPDDPTPLE